MNPIWLLLLLPLAAVSGWFLARRDDVSKGKDQDDHSKTVPSSYITGLNQLLNQQDDQALKTFLSLSKDQPEQVELQLTLGRLSRRKGEFERAILIHQSILDNQAYSSETQELAAYELAKNYYAAGLYDRAEKLFSDLESSAQHGDLARTYLLEIYQHEKDWHSAIEISQRFIRPESAKQHQHKAIHYHCELAAEHMAQGHFKQALEQVANAEKIDSNNPRTVILKGKVAAYRGRHQQAIDYWRQLQWHEPHYLGEVIGHLSNSYEVAGKEKELITFLKVVLKHNSDPRILSALIDVLKTSDKSHAVKHFLQEYLHNKPTLGGVHQLMVNWLALPDTKLSQDTAILVESIAKLIENQRNYACNACGFSADKLHWQCPACQQWDAVKPTNLLNSPLSKQSLANVSQELPVQEDFSYEPYAKPTQEKIKDV